MAGSNGNDDGDGKQAMEDDKPAGGVNVAEQMNSTVNPNHALLIANTPAIWHSGHFQQHRRRRNRSGGHHQQRRSRVGSAEKGSGKLGSDGGGPMTNKRKYAQQQMARAGLICSLLLLASICAVHLLFFGDSTKVTTNNNGDVRLGSPACQGRSLSAMPKRIRLPMQNEKKAIQKSGKAVDQFVQSQLEQFASEIANLPAHQQQDGQRHVNMLLTEQRRRPVPRHQRAATPIPRPARQPNSASNSENWPPPSSSPTASTSYTPAGVADIDGDEPTLMDFDAIDAYWRWDIEQEKGPASLLLHQQQYQPYHHGADSSAGFQQHQPEQWQPGMEPSELRYERDIQLLTEKSQFPELALHDYPTTEWVVDGEHEGYLLTDLSHETNNKWEQIPAQLWPTTSTVEGQNGGGTAEQKNKFLPYFPTAEHKNDDEGIGTELLNIPIGTPPPSCSTISTTALAGQNEPNSLLDDAQLSPNSSSAIPCALVPRSSYTPIESPTANDNDGNRPILFGDVSLGLAVADAEENGNDWHHPAMDRQAAASD